MKILKSKVFVFQNSHFLTLITGFTLLIISIFSTSVAFSAIPFVEKQYISLANDFTKMATSPSGEFIAISEGNDDSNSVLIYQLDSTGTQYSLVSSLTGSDIPTSDGGFASTLVMDNSTLVATGFDNSGRRSVYVFVMDPITGLFPNTESYKLATSDGIIPSDSIDISNGVIVVSTFNQGVAYVYRPNSDGSYPVTESHKLIIEDTTRLSFGSLVAIHEDTIVISERVEEASLPATLWSFVYHEDEDSYVAQSTFDVGDAGFTHTNFDLLQVSNELIVFGDTFNLFGLYRNTDGSFDNNSVFSFGSSAGNLQYRSLALLEDNIMVGATGSSTSVDGSVLVFEPDANGNHPTTETATLLPSTSSTGNGYGRSIGVSVDHIAVLDSGINNQPSGITVFEIPPIEISAVTVEVTTTTDGGTEIQQTISVVDGETVLVEPGTEVIINPILANFKGFAYISVDWNNDGQDDCFSQVNGTTVECGALLSPVYNDMIFTVRGRVVQYKMSLNQPLISSIK